MKKLLILIIYCVNLVFAQGETRTWRALGDFKIEAEFVAYEAGLVRLRKGNGQEIVVRIEKLTANDRLVVLDLAGKNARGAIPAGEIQKPTGRRELTWEPIVRGELWPDFIPEELKTALTGLDRGWKHAETRYFIVHYQQVGFAKQVARMADFQYQYIAADLPGFTDRIEEKSHIVVVRNPEDWGEFLSFTKSTQSWFAAFVSGKMMYVHDLGSSKANANLLAHEMSHLVLNRFFVHYPPLWLNEGLAEWYGNIGHSAFKGQKVDVERGLGGLANPFDLEKLTSMTDYPADPAEILRFYTTSRQLVGMLMLRKDQPTFVEFLKMITVEGKTFDIPLYQVYSISNIATLQQEFTKFLD